MDDKIRLHDTNLTEEVVKELSPDEQVRFVHSGCSTSANGSAYRTSSGVSLVCFKCGNKGFHFLGVPSLWASSGAVPVAKAKLSGPLRTIGNPLSVMARAFLFGYGIRPDDVNQFVAVDTNDNLVFLCENFDRAINGYAVRNIGGSPKWINVFDGDKPKYGVFWNRKAKITKCVVLAEDPVSALKIHYATGYPAICLLGLNMSKELWATIGVAFDSAIVWTDNDWSGITRGALIRDSLNAVIPTVMVNGIEGCKDPKDHDCEEIISVVSGALEVLREQQGEV